MDKKTIRKRKRGFISFLLSLVLAVQCFAVNTGATHYAFDNIVENNILQNGDTLDTSTKIKYYKGTTEYYSETGSSTINGAEYQKWKVTYIYKSAGAEEMHLIGIPTVSFDSQGGTAVAETAAEYDSTITAPTAPTKDNFTFGGWYKEAACTTAWDFSNDKVTVDVTLYAKWVPKYTVTLNTNCGTINSGDVTSYTYGTGATLPTGTNVTKTGHTFGGWFDNEECDGTAVGSITSTDFGNKTYWAKWTPINYTITWKNDDESTLKTTTVPYGGTPSYGTTDPTKPETAEYTYTFSGWDPAIAQVTGDTSYKAKYTAEGKTYSVTFNSNGGTINSGNVTSYTYGTETTLPANVTMTGHNFGGWYTNEECTGNAVTNIGTAETGNKEFWAKWTANTYTVTLNTKGGTINGDTLTSYTYGEGATLPANVTKTGHTFGGWYANEEFTGNPVTAITSTDIEDKEF